MKKLGVFAIITGMALYLGFKALDAQTALQAFGSWGYLWMFLGVSAFLLCVLKQSREPLWAFFSGGWRRWEVLVATIVIAATAGYCIAKESWRMRIVMDEPVLMATSFSMANYARTYAPSRGYNIGGDFLLMDTVDKDPLSRSVDKRPIFYPFLTSILHQLHGFSFENGSLMNNLLCGLFFIVLYLFLRQGMHWVLACSALVCVAALPLMPWVANGAGMELTALFMGVTTAWAASAYLKKTDAWSLSTLCLSTFLLAQSRYEMVLFVPIVGLVILLGWWRVRRIVTSWIFFITPLLFVPYAWQQRFFTTQEDPFDLRLARFEGVLEAKDGPFGLSYLWPNIKGSLEFFFSRSFRVPHNHPNSAYLSLLSVLGLLYFFYALVRHSKQLRRDPFFQVLAFWGLGFFLIYLLNMLYVWGNITQRLTYRFSLPFSIVGIIAFCWMLQRLKWRRSWVMGTQVVVSVLIFAHTASSSHLNALHAEYFFRDAVYDQIDWVREHVHEHPLCILDMTALSITQGADTLSCTRAQTNKHKIQAYRKAHPERPIYVFTLGYVNTFSRRYPHPLEEYGFVLEPLKTSVGLGGNFARLSAIYRLKDLELTPEEASRVPPAELLPTRIADLAADTQKALGFYLLP